MGGITTGVGLFSGINTSQLIDQLLAIEARPRTLIQNRIVNLQQQQAAFLDINTTLLALKSASRKFEQDKVFNSASATSSDSAVLSGIAGTSAVPGSFQFIVDRLVSSQQHLSRGFADSSTAAVGATSFTFENGGGALATDTKLTDLNGFAGVNRGKFTITDKAGGSAAIDLTKAVTVTDVLDAINSNGTIAVNAVVEGDHFTLTDTSGGGGALTIADVFGSTTATSLGIKQTLGAGVGVGTTLTGQNIRILSGTTSLAALNDGNGVLIGASSPQGSETPDFTITDRNGGLHTIFLGELTTSTTDPVTNVVTTTIVQSRASTVQDAIDIINATTGGAVTAALSADKTRIELTDTTGGAGNFSVDNGLSGRTTATDLGIDTVTGGVASSTVTGKRLIASLNSTLTRQLNGGSGLQAGSLTVTDRSGANTTVNFVNSELVGSVSDIVNLINTKIGGAVGVSAQINDAGNGIKLVDTTGGAGALSASGTFATDLGIASSVTADVLQGASAQLQWITRATRIDSLNGGQGIGTGTIRITTTDGSITTVNINDNQTNIQELIKQIEAQATGFTVNINAQGDGLVITDTAGGPNQLKIEDATGTVAKKLNLAGTAATGNTFIDGSFEKTVTFLASDTLDEVANKINQAGVAVTASIIRDGSGSAPFRLSLSARSSGSAGRSIIDTGGFDLGLTTLSKGDDAVVFFGSSDPAKAVLLTTSSNTLDNVIQGVTVDLASTSSQPVELTVTRNLEQIETDIGAFVEAFNTVMSKLDQHDRFDAKTETKGILFGDPTVASMRRDLLSTIQGQPTGISGSFDRLFEVGVKLGSNGQIEFDREKFRASFEADPQGVSDLFAARSLIPKNEFTDLGNGVKVRNTASNDQFSSLGVAEMIAQVMGNYTNTVNGRLTNKNDSLDDLIKIQEGRVTDLNGRLDAKRARLERQFLAMEQAIAQLQTQSQALSQLG